MAASTELRRRAQERWRERREHWTGSAGQRLEARDAARFVARAARWYPDAYEPLAQLYGRDRDVGALLDDLLAAALDAVTARPARLRRRDDRREVDPEWLHDESMVAYMCYADRFAGDLAGVAERLDHLRDLGVTYLHLMPLLQPRAGANDGGYAVADYRAVDPRLGTMDDLRALAATLHEHDMSLCIDLVVNHTAREHEWAQRAIAGEQRYRDHYLLFADRELPDAYERTLPEVFPDRAPGNFTWVDGVDAWVWTTFHDYQWDLDYTNPDVFAGMLGVLFDLANVGVDVFRLDAVPFTWKRLGTDCQNQPEAHLLLQAFRALLRIAAPAVACKAEAIVAPDELVQYLGAHELDRRECDLAYHNQLMVLLWSAAASRDARLATAALQRLRTPPPDATWITYLRCHDDIGWAITDRDAAAVGEDADAHRRFLVDFYAGDFPGSFATGARFGVNDATGDARTSGTAASLAGIEQALAAGDDALLDSAVSRLVALYAVVYGWGGIPLLYMGDEVGLRNAAAWRDDPALAGDNRWMHRPHMDWDVVARRREAGTLEHRLFTAFAHLGARRSATPQLHAHGAPTVPLGHDARHVLAWLHDNPRRGPLLGVANLHDDPQSVDADLCRRARLGEPRDVLGLWPVDIRDGRIHLPPLSVAWLTDG